MKHKDKRASLDIDRLKAVHKADREMFGHFRPAIASSKKAYNRARDKRLALEY